jgi:hypothetical protein
MTNQPERNFAVTRYNSQMRSTSIILFLTFSTLTLAQNAAPTSAADTKFTTVPITIDHTRVILDVYLPLPDGTSKRIRAWVDTGDPQLQMSERVDKLMNLGLSCDADSCTAPAPREITIGTMRISLASDQPAIVPRREKGSADVMMPGMSAEIKIPSTVLRNYDVLINFPDREFSIGTPGTLKFKGVKSKMVVNPASGFIQVPGKIENKNYNLGFDIGSSISFLSGELFDKLASAHPAWPHMTGAVGPANMGEANDDEENWKVMRIERVQYGPLFLTEVPMAGFTKEFSEFFEKNNGTPIAGLIGSEAVMNYRIGLDYAHSTIYFDLGSTFKFPDFDVVGLTLRPEVDTRFTIIGIADFDGKPSIPEVQPGDHLAAVDGIPVPDSTLGQTWSALEGFPGQERKLTIERAGKQFTVSAKVQHFLGVVEERKKK